MTGEPLTAEEVAQIKRGLHQLSAVPRAGREAVHALAASHELLRARLEQAERLEREAEDEINTLGVRIERLERERDEWKTRWHTAHRVIKHRAEALVQARQALREIASLPGETWAFTANGTGWCEIARAALAAAGEPGAGADE